MQLFKHWRRPQSPRRETVNDSFQAKEHHFFGSLLLQIWKFIVTRAMLGRIYHHALHNDFYTARDMLLMSSVLVEIPLLASLDTEERKAISVDYSTLPTGKFLGEMPRSGSKQKIWI
jgi:hypothetical protein